MDSAESTFESTFLKFIEEGKKAFPEKAALLEAARVRFDEDEGVLKSFGEDCVPLMGFAMAKDAKLLSNIGNTSLFKDFEVPDNAAEENKAIAMDYLIPLTTIAFTLSSVPQQAISRLDGLFQNQALMDTIVGPMGEMNSMGDILGSQAGQKMVGDVAKAMGFEMDMDDPMVRSAMGMMGMMM